MHLDDIIQHADKFQVSTLYMPCISKSTAEQSKAQDDMNLSSQHSLFNMIDCSVNHCPALPCPALRCSALLWQWSCRL